MSEAETPAGVVRDFPLAPNRANLTLRTLADVYMANFAGRDTTRTYSVAFWVRELGERGLIEIDADAVADVLDCLVATPVTKFVGKEVRCCSHYRYCVACRLSRHFSSATIVPWHLSRMREALACSTSIATSLDSSSSGDRVR